MENYEIRIVKGSGGPIVYPGAYISDVAAVRKARAITGDKDIVEVWRGDHCIYARNVDRSPARALLATRGARE